MGLVRALERREIPPGRRSSKRLARVSARDCGRNVRALAVTQSTRLPAPLRSRPVRALSHNPSVKGIAADAEPARCEREIALCSRKPAPSRHACTAPAARNPRANRDNSPSSMTGVRVVAKPGRRSGDVRMAYPVARASAGACRASCSSAPDRPAGAPCRSHRHHRAAPPWCAACCRNWRRLPGQGCWRSTRASSGSSSIARCGACRCSMRCTSTSQSLRWRSAGECRVNPFRRQYRSARKRLQPPLPFRSRCVAHTAQNPPPPAGTPQRHYLTLLQHAQQPRLHGQRHIADLVQKQRASVRLANASRRALAPRTGSQAPGA